MLPPGRTVAEILETVEPEDRIVAACKRLKSSGYTLALDDFAPHDPRTPLCEFADIIKVDIRATRPEERAGMMRRFGSAKCKMLAEKVETPHEFHQARDMGFTLFQGYFFCRPELVTGREVPASRLHYVRLLEMVSRPELEMRQLERMLKQEASISYRLLRYLNSPLFGFSLEIKSIRHAMAVMGERELRRWIRLVVAVGAAEQKCSELVLMGLTRGRFCELLSNRVQSNSDLFLLGLLSIMDAVLEVSMDVLLEAATRRSRNQGHAPRAKLRSPPTLQTHAGARIGRVVGINPAGAGNQNFRRRNRRYMVAGPAMGTRSDGRLIENAIDAKLRGMQHL